VAFNPTLRCSDHRGHQTARRSVRVCAWRFVDLQGHVPESNSHIAVALPLRREQYVAPMAGGTPTGRMDASGPRAATRMSQASAMPQTRTDRRAVDGRDGRNI